MAGASSLAAALAQVKSSTKEKKESEVPSMPPDDRQSAFAVKRARLNYVPGQVGSEYVGNTLEAFVDGLTDDENYLPGICVYVNGGMPINLGLEPQDLPHPDTYVFGWTVLKVRCTIPDLRYDPGVLLTRRDQAPQRRAMIIEGIMRGTVLDEDMYGRPILDMYGRPKEMPTHPGPVVIPVEMLPPIIPHPPPMMPMMMPMPPQPPMPASIPPPSRAHPREKAEDEDWSEKKQQPPPSISS